MPAARDFYEILGLPPSASQDDIQRAYRVLARTYHPDVNKDVGAEERFKEISEAYSVLSDPDTRRRYDVFGPGFRQVPQGADPQDWARSRSWTPGRAGTGAGRSAGGAGRSAARAGRGDARSRRSADEGAWSGSRAGGDIDLEDLFGGLFSGGARWAGGPLRGVDQEAEIELGVEDVYRGGRRTITLTRPAGPQTIDVNIPPGATDGQRIRLAGQGARGDGAPAGDLYLVVRIAQHPRYRVDGRDIHMGLPLAPWEAALGASVTTETPGGEVRVTVPPGTSSGRRLRLRGRGMPNPRGLPGDLYAEVRIMVPARLSDAERRLFQDLAAVSPFDSNTR